jgi:hypothetical protein
MTLNLNEVQLTDQVNVLRNRVNDLIINLNNGYNSIAVIASEASLPLVAERESDFYLIREHTVTKQPAVAYVVDTAWFFDTIEKYPYLTAQYKPVDASLIGSGVITNKVVFKSATTGKWELASGTVDDKNPMAIVGIDNNLVFSGMYYSSSLSLTPGSRYYCDNVGQLTTTANNYYVGTAVDTKNILLDGFGYKYEKVNALETELDNHVQNLSNPHATKAENLLSDSTNVNYVLKPNGIGGCQWQPVNSSESMIGGLLPKWYNASLQSYTPGNIFSVISQDTLSLSSLKTGLELSYTDNITMQLSNGSAIFLNNQLINAQTITTEDFTLFGNGKLLLKPTCVDLYEGITWTDNTEGDWTVSSSDRADDIYEVMNGTNLSTSITAPSKNYWIQGQTTGSAVTLCKYAIRADSNSGVEHPIDWTFEGSSNGIDWTVLDSRVNEDFTSGQEREYEFEPQGAFTYWRLNVSNTVIASNTAELRKLTIYDLKGSLTSTSIDAFIVYDDTDPSVYNYLLTNDPEWAIVQTELNGYTDYFKLNSEAITTDVNGDLEVFTTKNMPDDWSKENEMYINGPTKGGTLFWGDYDYLNAIDSRQTKEKYYDNGIYTTDTSDVDDYPGYHVFDNTPSTKWISMQNILLLQHTSRFSTPTYRVDTNSIDYDGTDDLSAFELYNNDLSTADDFRYHIRINFDALNRNAGFSSNGSDGVECLQLWMMSDNRLKIHLSSNGTSWDIAEIEGTKNDWVTGVDYDFRIWKDTPNDKWIVDWSDDGKDIDDITKIWTVEFDITNSNNLFNPTTDRFFTLGGDLYGANYHLNGKVRLNNTGMYANGAWILQPVPDADIKPTAYIGRKNSDKEVNSVKMISANDTSTRDPISFEVLSTSDEVLKQTKKGLYNFNIDEEGNVDRCWSTPNEILNPSTPYFVTKLFNETNKSADDCFFGSTLDLDDNPFFVGRENKTGQSIKFLELWSRNSSITATPADWEVVYTTDNIADTEEIANNITYYNSEANFIDNVKGEYYYDTSTNFSDTSYNYLSQNLFNKIMAHAGDAWESSLYPSGLPLVNPVHVGRKNNTNYELNAVTITTSSATNYHCPTKFDIVYTLDNIGFQENDTPKLSECWSTGDLNTTYSKDKAFALRNINLNEGWLAPNKTEVHLVGRVNTSGAAIEMIQLETRNDGTNVTYPTDIDIVYTTDPIADGATGNDIRNLNFTTVWTGTTSFTGSKQLEDFTLTTPIPAGAKYFLRINATGGSTSNTGIGVMRPIPRLDNKSMVTAYTTEASGFTGSSQERTFNLTTHIPSGANWFLRIREATNGTSPNQYVKIGRVIGHTDLKNLNFTSAYSSIKDIFDGEQSNSRTIELDTAIPVNAKYFLKVNSTFNNAGFDRLGLAGMIAKPDFDSYTTTSHLTVADAGFTSLGEEKTFELDTPIDANKEMFIKFTDYKAADSTTMRYPAASIADINFISENYQLIPELDNTTKAYIVSNGSERDILVTNDIDKTINGSMSPANIYTTYQDIGAFITDNNSDIREYRTRVTDYNSVLTNLMTAIRQTFGSSAGTLTVDAIAPLGTQEIVTANCSYNRSSDKTYRLINNDGSIENELTAYMHIDDSGNHTLASTLQGNVLTGEDGTYQFYAEENRASKNSITASGWIYRR